MARVSRCKIFINGAQNTDLKSFKSNSRVVAKTVMLMHKTDYFNVTPENVFTIDYAVPSGKTEFDFDSVLDGTATINVAKDGGGSYLFSNCRCLEIGEETMDNENELVKTITIFAEDRVDE